MGFRGEHFHGLLTRTAYCPLSLQTITESTFADKITTAKFVKVFSIENSLYIYMYIVVYSISYNVHTVTPSSRGVLLSRLECQLGWHLEPQKTSAHWMWP